MLPVKTFRTPGVVITGSGAAEQVGEECKKLNVSKALIVSDENLMKLGVPDPVQESLRRSGIDFAVYDGANTEPIAEYVQEGLETYRENGCDFLLAVGGGSPMDTAKAIGIMVTNPGSIEDYMGHGRRAARWWPCPPPPAPAARSPPSPSSPTPEPM